MIVRHQRLLALGTTITLGSLAFASAASAGPIGWTQQFGSSATDLVEDIATNSRGEVFVVGDLAHAVRAGKEVPGVAQGAIQGGRHVASIIAWAARGEAGDRPAFRYRDKGSMATIGRASAVVVTGRVAIHGFIAWLMWWVVHILFLVGFKNRVLVVFSWAWSWVTFSRGARLITGPVGPLPAIRGIAADGSLALPPAASPVELPADAAASASRG